MRRFNSSFDTTTRDLASTLRKMGATARIDFGERIFKTWADRLDNFGIAYEDRRATDLPTKAIRITFWREEKGYAYESRSWDHVLDNLRACQWAISSQYRCFEEYRVTRPGVEGGFEALFGGFLLLGDGRREWWEVLQVPRDASEREVESAYRRKARTAHPDKGGTEEEFNRLVQAYEQARLVMAGRGTV